jgi:PAS domain S-box-containing protein
VLGYGKPGELSGQAALDMVHPDSKAVVAERLRRAALERIDNPPAEIRVRLRDGVERDLESVSQPVAFHGRPAVQVVFRDVTEHKATDAKLHEYRQALRSLASRISLVEEQERRRIASALHDHIAQTLALSKIKLGVTGELTGDAQTARQLAEVRELIQQCIDYTRSLVFDLSPPILYEMGLEAALSRLAERMEDQYGIQTQFEDDGAPKPLEDDVRTVLVQATRELLVNAAKHAGPCRVKVFTRVQEGNIVVRIEDDGAGFDTGGDALRVHESSGFGLFNVRERLDQIGGRLELRSQPGRGTAASLVAPLKRRPDHQPGAER